MATPVSLTAVVAIVAVSFIRVVGASRDQAGRDELAWSQSQQSVFHGLLGARDDASLDGYGYDYPPAYDLGTSLPIVETTTSSSLGYSSGTLETPSTTVETTPGFSFSPPPPRTGSSVQETSTLLSEPRSLESGDVSSADSTSAQPYPLPGQSQSKTSANVSDVATSSVVAESTKEPISPPETTSNLLSIVTVTVTDFVSQSDGDHATASVGTVNEALSSHTLPSATAVDASVLTLTSLRTVTIYPGSPASNTSSVIATLQETGGITTQTPAHETGNNVSFSSSLATAFTAPSSTQGWNSSLTTQGESTGSTHQSQPGHTVITITETMTVTPMPPFSTTVDDIPTSTITDPLHTPSTPFYPLPFNSSTSYWIHASTRLTWLSSSRYHSSNAGQVSSSLPSNLTGTATTTVDAVVTASISEYPTVNNATLAGAVASWDASSTGSAIPPTSARYPSGANHTVSVTQNETSLSSAVVSTKVVTITVYPTPKNSSFATDQTLVSTIHATLTSSVVVAPPFPLTNSSMPFPSGTAYSTGLVTEPFTTGRVDPWDTSRSSLPGSYNSSTRAPSVDTACISGYHNATTLSTLPPNTPSARSTSNATSVQSRPTTFETSTSASHSSSSSGQAEYPPPPQTTSPEKVLPGDPNFPWGSSGPLHRLQDVNTAGNNVERRVTGRWASMVASFRSLFPPEQAKD